MCRGKAGGSWEGRHSAEHLMKRLPFTAEVSRCHQSPNSRGKQILSRVSLGVPTGVTLPSALHLKGDTDVPQ